MSNPNPPVPSPIPLTQVLPTVVIPFTAYLFLFVGMGLVAGSVVHLGEVAAIARYITIGFVGMGLFVLGSYLQEIRLNPQGLPKRRILQYVIYSLALAVGIGMISGGTQHFLDFPGYASFLLPMGFVLALVAYVLRHNLKLSLRAWNALLIGALALALPLFLGLNHYAHGLPASEAQGGGHHHAAPATVPGAVPTSPAQSLTPGAAPGMTHGAVASDADFLQQMIPHHQEAVESSAYVLTRTDNPKLRQFLGGVIQTQAEEVAQMRQWHQDWLGKPYEDAGTYQPMMGALSSFKGEALEAQYIQGMIHHHQGAIAMAQQIQTITQRPELEALATAILKTQTQEVEQLQQWLAGLQPAAHDATPHQH